MPALNRSQIARAARALVVGAVVIPPNGQSIAATITGVPIVGKPLYFKLPAGSVAVATVVWSKNTTGSGPVAISGATANPLASVPSDLGWPSVSGTLVDGTVFSSLTFNGLLTTVQSGSVVSGDYTTGLYAYPVALAGYPSAQHAMNLKVPGFVRNVAGDASGNIAHYVDITAAPGAWSAGSELFSHNALTQYGADYNIMSYWQTAGVQAAASVMANPNSATTTRPSASTGTGFFVKAGDLYDSTGARVVLDGVNRCHSDSDATGMYNTGMNCCRMFMNLTLSWSVQQALMNEMLAHKVIPIPTCAGVGTNAGTATSGSSDPAVMTAATQLWVDQATNWKSIPNSIINVANEWGPTGSSSNTVWRDSCVTSIGGMRGAGYTGPLMYDAPGSGQDSGDNGNGWTIRNHSQALMDADPQKNIIIGLHIYGNWAPGELLAYLQDLRAFSLTSGIVFAITEYGPARVSRGDASHTYVEALEVRGDCMVVGMGCIVWAWDDTPADTTGTPFSMVKNAGSYVTGTAGFASSTSFPNGNPADLFDFGTDVVLHPVLGMRYTSVKAPVFG